MGKSEDSARVSHDEGERHSNITHPTASHLKQSPHAITTHPKTSMPEADDEYNHYTAESEANAFNTDHEEEEDNTSHPFAPPPRRSTLSKSYTTSEDETVLHKLDRNLVYFLAFLYLLSFLDRSNIGNARIAGLESALRLSSRQFDLLLVAFYVTYIAFQWMILLYRLLPAHVYIGLCVLAWGVVASWQSAVNSFAQLLVLRALLGVSEAAFSPGLPFYMTFFYRREELAYRVGLQISAAPLATGVASSVAWVVAKLSEGTGLEPWRALFLFEGAPSVVVALLAWYWIPDGPGTARFLTPRERKVGVLRIQSENQLSVRNHARSSKSSKSSSPASSSSSSPWLNLTDLRETLTDPKSWFISLIFFSVNISFASLPVFLPTIINSMSFSPVTSQILAAPPYLFAFAFVLLIGHYSDKTANSRGLFLCAVAGLSCLSYTTIAIASALHGRLGEGLSIAIRYVAIYGAAMGLFASVILIITWTLNNQHSSTGKGVGMVLLNVVGQCGPLVGVQLFPEDEGPLYIKGISICAGFMGCVAVMSLGLRWHLSVLNSKADLERREYEMVGVMGESDEANGVELDREGEQEGLMGGHGGNEKIRERFRYML